MAMVTDTVTDIMQKERHALSKALTATVIIASAKKATFIVVDTEAVDTVSFERKI